MTARADKIMERVSAHHGGRWVCTPGDFLDLGGREAVSRALSRLVKAGRLRRVGHGLYDRPRISSVLNRPAPVDLEAAIAALARRDGVRIMPDGMVAANQLGLTNAVPAKVSYVTDGHSRTLEIDGRTVRFRHAGPRVMQWAGRPAAPVVQALRWLGRRAASDGEAVSTLSRHLPDHVKLDLLRNSRDLPGWALPLARSIASDQAGDRARLSGHAGHDPRRGT
ncbi:MAG: DUF6088 family protein [Gemmatimonadaceae bacterium]|nr:DUF6088 family protein [Gemmatimonadaceae bacterium]